MTSITTALCREINVDFFDHTDDMVLGIACTFAGDRVSARLTPAELDQLREALKVPTPAVEYMDADGDMWKLENGSLHLKGSDGMYREALHSWGEVNEEYGPLVPVQSLETRYVVALSETYLKFPGVADALEDAEKFRTKDEARRTLLERESLVTELGGEIASARIAKVRGSGSQWALQ